MQQVVYDNIYKSFNSDKSDKSIIINGNNITNEDTSIIRSIKYKEDECREGHRKRKSKIFINFN